MIFKLNEKTFHSKHRKFKFQKTRENPSFDGKLRSKDLFTKFEMFGM